MIKEEENTGELFELFDKELLESSFSQELSLSDEEDSLDDDDDDDNFFDEEEKEDDDEDEDVK
jgi:hypothetical protein